MVTAAARNVRAIRNVWPAWKPNRSSQTNDGNGGDSELSIGEEFSLFDKPRAVSLLQGTPGFQESNELRIGLDFTNFSREDRARTIRKRFFR